MWVGFAQSGSLMVDLALSPDMDSARSAARDLAHRHPDLAGLVDICYGARRHDIEIDMDPRRYRIGKAAAGVCAGMDPEEARIAVSKRDWAKKLARRAQRNKEMQEYTPKWGSKGDA